MLANTNFDDRRTRLAGLQAAIAAHQAGDLTNASGIYERLLVLSPNDAELLYLLGTLESQRGNLKAAIELLESAIRENPSISAAYQNLGNTYFKFGDPELATRHFEAALLHDPKNLGARINLALALSKKENYRDAMQEIEVALAVDPSHAKANLLKACLLERIGQRDKAISQLESYALPGENLGRLMELSLLAESIDAPEIALHFLTKLLEAEPTNLEARVKKAYTLLRLDNTQAASEEAEQLMLSWPSYSGIYELRAHLHMRERNYAKALTCINKSLEFSGQAYNSLNTKGLIQQHLSDWRGAVKTFSSAIRLDSNPFEATFNKAALYKHLNRPKPAARYFAQSLRLNPLYAPALDALVESLEKLHAHEQAIEAFELTKKYLPTTAYREINEIYLRYKIGDWTREPESNNIFGLIGNDPEKPPHPFRVIGICGDPEIQHKAARIWAEKNYSKLGEPILCCTRRPKIRLAYIGGEMRQHAMGILTAGIFEAHDRESFEVIGISLTEPGHSDYAKRITGAFDKFINAANMQLDELITKCRALEIDIAIDLDGYTSSHRTELFAQRIAPIQINYLGYPGTMGAPFMDYIIADHTVIPDGNTKYFSEAIIYMPDSYQANDDKRFIPLTGTTRTQFGLPESKIIFCCFNNSYKIRAQTFKLWMSILSKVPESVLWLLQDNTSAPENFRKHAAELGVDPSRLIFAPSVGYKLHLTRLQHADILLDTLPYNAHTTGSDALWAGVPMITLAGQSFAARVGASLLAAARLEDLVTSTPADYESLAVELAMNPGRLKTLKEHLRKNRFNLPLFDTRHFVSDLEIAFKEVHERAVLNKPVVNINVATSRRG
jgi:protein O-GlcNAc transferase